ncbi:polysaccharide deacetylase family protein [Candidatus Chlorohelix sp.]|uniref:polysaccharide deacetylase family protein n=1 Tax=Candidatus Chlorohelix sp. TaxID=3139201 RepID=UPI0030561EC9
MKRKPKNILVGSSLAIILIFFANLLPVTAASPENGFSHLAEIAAAVNVRNPRQFQYYNQTGHSVSGPILRYYRSTGGITRHGYPITELFLRDGRYFQYFERSVLEFHPDYSDTPQEVTPLPLFEADNINNNATVPVFESTTERWYFPETSHSMSGEFLSFWRNNGDRLSLGLPLSEPFEETQPDDSKLLVQYFEYAKLEYHPDSDGVQIAHSGLKRAEAELEPQFLVTAPLARLTEQRQIRIPSLMFHYVRTVDRKKDLLGYRLSVTPETFDKYLDWLKDNGYHTVTLEQVMDSLKYGVQLPEKAVNLRFDDGHSDMWTAYLALKQRGMTATFYVITQRLELLPEQWREIDQAGFEVAPHTRTHPDLRTVRDLNSEINGSKQDLEAMLGHPTRTFSYPYGKYSDAIIKSVTDSGFEMAVTTDGGYNFFLNNMYKQPTISVTGDDTMQDFINKVKVGTR